MADLDPTVSVKIKKILAKDINELTDYDKSFLRARIDYIGANSRARLADILGASDGEKEEEQERVKEVKETKQEAEEQSQKDLNAHLEPVDEDEEEDEIIDDEEEEDEPIG